MLRPRAIPCLLLRRGRLVKTVRFASPTYVGDPINAVRIFNDMEVDEIVVLDIGATVDGTGIPLELIGEMASECFMPRSRSSSCSHVIAKNPRASVIFVTSITQAPGIRDGV